MKTMLKLLLLIGVCAALLVAVRRVPPEKWQAWGGQAREWVAQLRSLAADQPGSDRDDERAQAANGTGRPGRSVAGEEETAAPSHLEKVDGLTAVRLSRQAQKQTGIEVRPLVERTHLSEALAAGKVLDIQPLVELRAGYNAARGEQEVARTALATSAKTAGRLRLLHNEDANVSARQLQEAEAQSATDKARLWAAERRLQDIRNEALQQWGGELVSMALAEDSRPFEQLVSHQEVLLLVTLQPGVDLPDGMQAVYVGPTGERERARKAYLVSPAAQTDTVSQGETYFFRTDASRLRTGMRMDAWIPQDREPKRGVEVPGSAVIWYAGSLWVYVRSGEDLFVRHPLAEHEETRDGWFVTAGLKPGEEIVVSGAQMLFSEEFRTSIPGGDDSR